MMGKSSVAYYTFEVKPKRPKHPEVVRSVNDVNAGVGILAYLENFLEFQKNHGFLKDSYHRRIIGISNYQVRGKTILIKAVSGSFGEEADLVDVLSGRVTSHLSKDSAAVRESRIFFTCPTETNIAEAAVEYREEAQAYYLLKAFASQMRSLFPDCNAPIHPILEREDWIEHGKLKEISLPVKGVKNQIAVSGGLDEDSDRIEEVGQFVLSVRPGARRKFFDQRLWDGLRKGKIRQSAFLTLPEFVEDKDVNELGIRATVQGSNGTTKSFLIGNEKYPSVKELLTDYGAPYLADNVFRDRVGNQIFLNYKASGADLHSGWDSGALAGMKLTEQPSWIEEAGDDGETDE